MYRCFSGDNKNVIPEYRLREREYENYEIMTWACRIIFFIKGKKMCSEHKK